MILLDRIRASYTSAGAFPIKLLAHTQTLRAKGIRPLHPQIMLTNICQLKCGYCSCSKRPINDAFFPPSLSSFFFRDYVTRLKLYGAGAVTLTGGGEPLLHDHFTDFLGELKCLNYKVGLVTNGLAMKDYDPHLFTEFAWIRISMDSNRTDFPAVPLGLKHAYSFVFRPGDENSEMLRVLIGKARKGAIVHLRIVSDILDPDAGYELAKFQAKLAKDGDVPARVIFQPRAEYTPGSKKCWISLLKPVVDVDGRIYPCCGAQYAKGLEEPSRKMPPDMAMGDLHHYVDQHLNPQKPFDGSKCKVCYYRKYNDFLELIHGMNHLEDIDFV